MLSVLAIPAVILALAPFHSSSAPLPAPVRTAAQGRAASGAPGLPGRRCRTCGCSRSRTGASTGTRTRASSSSTPRAAGPLARVFGKLYALHFPIRHLQLADMYGPTARPPPRRDVSGSFDCRQAVPSPCTGGTGTGTWSMHAYGLAVDVNPVENPYVGCGQSRDPAAKPYFDRSRHRRGMVTPRAIARLPVDRLGLGRLLDRRTRRTTCTSRPPATDRSIGARAPARRRRGA